MKRAVWRASMLSRTQHGQGCILFGKDRVICRAVTWEAVPSGLSFSRNHFLKRKKREKINFCYYFSRNTGILETLLPTFS